MTSLHSARDASLHPRLEIRFNNVAPQHPAETYTVNFRRRYHPLSLIENRSGRETRSFPATTGTVVLRECLPQHVVPDAGR